MQRALDLSAEAVATALTAKTLAQVANDAATQAVAVLVQCSGEDTAFGTHRTPAVTSTSTTTNASATTKGLLIDDGQVGCVPSIAPRAPKSAHMSAEGSRLASASSTPPMTSHKGKSKKGKAGSKSSSAGAGAVASNGAGEKSGEKGEMEQVEAARMALLPQEVSSICTLFDHVLTTLWTCTLF